MSQIPILISCLGGLIRDISSIYTYKRNDTKVYFMWLCNFKKKLLEFVKMIDIELSKISEVKEKKVIDCPVCHRQYKFYHDIKMCHLRPCPKFVKYHLKPDDMEKCDGKCGLAHMLPDMVKTEKCYHAKWGEYCKKENCTYAHNEKELRCKWYAKYRTTEPVNEFKYDVSHDVCCHKDEHDFFWHDKK